MIRAATIALLASTCFPAVAQVDTGLLGTAPVSKRVETLRDLRYRDIVRQQYDFSCGSAALATLLNGVYGEQVTETALITQMMQGVDVREVVQKGFSMLDMKRYIEASGMQARGFRVDTQALYRLRVPVIALHEYKGYKHFVVVKGAASGRVFVADPALGHRVIPETDFAKGWNGIVLAVVTDRPLKQSTIVDGRQSAALRRRVDALGIATLPVPVVELGLVRADLF